MFYLQVTLQEEDGHKDVNTLFSFHPLIQVCDFICQLYDYIHYSLGRFRCIIGLICFIATLLK